MAIHHGNDGVVTVGGSVVASVREFTLEESIETVDASYMGGTNRLYKTGLKDWSASISCLFDETDTTGQEAMGIGAEVTLVLYPEGNQSGDVSYTMTGLVETVSIGVSADDIVSRSFTIKPANASGITVGTVV